MNPNVSFEVKNARLNRKPCWNTLIVCKDSNWKRSILQAEWQAEWHDALDQILHWFWASESKHGSPNSVMNQTRLMHLDHFIYQILQPAAPCPVFHIRGSYILRFTVPYLHSNYKPQVPKCLDPPACLPGASSSSDPWKRRVAGPQER